MTLSQQHPTSGDTVSEETDDSTQLEQDPKDNNVVLAQLAFEGPVTPLALFANDPPPKDTKNLSTKDTQNPPTNDETPKTFLLSFNYFFFLYLLFR